MGITGTVTGQTTLALLVVVLETTFLSNYLELRGTHTLVPPSLTCCVVCSFNSLAFKRHKAHVKMYCMVAV